MDLQRVVLDYALLKGEGMIKKKLATWPYQQRTKCFKELLFFGQSRRPRISNIEDQSEFPKSVFVRRVFSKDEFFECVFLKHTFSRVYVSRGYFSKVYFKVVFLKIAKGHT